MFYLKQYLQIVKPQKDVFVRLQQRLLHESRSVRSVKQKMKKLAPAFNQYMDLDHELASRHHRMAILLGLFGNDRVEQMKTNDEAKCLEEALEDHMPLNELRERLKLWRAIREFLRVAGKSTIGEIHAFLTGMGIENITRQAIESALKQHGDAFEISRHGHERYISLRRKSQAAK